MKLKDNDIVKKLIFLGIPTELYAVFGSGPMFAHEIRSLEDLSDLDIVIMPGAWNYLDFDKAKMDDVWGCNKLILEDGEIEIHDGWGPGEWDIEALIREAEIIDDIPFVQLKKVLEWKKMMGRDKDIEHTKQIEKFFE